MKTFLGAAALAMTLAAAPAFATTSFAQYEQIDGGLDTVLYDDGTLSDTGGLTGSLVAFNFLDLMPPALDGQIDAWLNIDASDGPGGYGGTISFLRVGDLANLLTVTFTGAVLSGAGGSGSFLDSQPGGGSVIFTSDFLDFSNTVAADFGLAFSGIDPGFGATRWTADSVGTFASDTRGGPGGIIPEPATWAMMIIGFGGVGALMRRRRLAFTAA